MDSIILRRGDIIFFRGNHFISKAIRVMTRSIGEGPTIVNHVGVVVEDGLILDAHMVEAIAPLIAERTLRDYKNEPQTKISVARPRNLSDDVLNHIAESARKFVSKKYGWGRIALFALGLEHLARNDKWPVCSVVVAESYWENGLTFGKKKPYETTPDDLYDFCSSNPDKYTIIVPLQDLKIS